MPAILGIIISKQLATLKELQEYYTYEDCLDLLDIILTDNYNEKVIAENYKEKLKK